MSDKKWRDVTRESPCAFCGKPDWCTVSTDGRVANCRRPEGEKGAKKQNSDGSWFHVLVEDDRPRGRRRKPGATASEADKTDVAASAGSTPAEEGRTKRDWHAWAKIIASRVPVVFADAVRQSRQLSGDTVITSEMVREEMATSLGLPASGLEPFPLVGFLDSHYDWMVNDGFFTLADKVDGSLRKPATSWPEVDPNGRVIGINRRWKAGSGPIFDGQEKTKLFFPGGNRGLTIPTPLDLRPNQPLLITEGPTCCAAATAASLACVGRPSVSDGVEMLAELIRLRGFTGPVILFGENDQKPDGKWPGRDAARRSAEKLADMIGRPVQFVLPPDGFKDLRAYLTAESWGDTPWPDRGAALLAHIEATAEEVGTSAANQPSNDSGRPRIVLSEQEHLATTDALRALAVEPNIFRCGTTLVALVPGEREGDGSSIQTMSESDLRQKLTKIADIVRLTSSGELIPAHPDKWLIDSLRDRKQAFEGVRPLQAVATHPIFLADGSVLSTPGYHAPTGTLLLPDCEVNVPEFPTPEDARRAADDILDLVIDFPFVTSADRAAWLSALITPFAHHSAYTGPCPLFWMDKNTPSAGGTMLTRLISMIVTGQDATMTPYTHDTNETRKLITALSLSRPELLVFDNVEGKFGNAALSMFLTATRRSDRILGVSSMANSEFRPIPFATSNNGVLAADMHRRVVPVRMATLLEKPELKTGFKHPKVLEHAKRMRPALISAALTILRAWHVAGRPSHGLPSFGSFDDWSDVVREAVMFATGIDPAATRVAAAAVDTRVAAVTAILAAWPHLDPDNRGLMMSKLVDRINQARKDVAVQPEWMDGVIEAAEELCGGANITTQSLGNALRSYNGRTLSGMVLEGKSGHGKVNRWHVRVIDEAAAMASRNPTVVQINPVAVNGSSGPEATEPHPDGGGGGGGGGHFIPSRGEKKSPSDHEDHEDHGSGDGVEGPLHPLHPLQSPKSDPPSRDAVAHLLRAAGMTWESIREFAGTLDPDTPRYLPERLEQALSAELEFVATILAERIGKPPPLSG